MEVAPVLAMFASGLLVAPLRRGGGIGAVWALLAAAGLLLSWLSARSWAALLRAGHQLADYGPADERWAIAAGLVAAGTVATLFAARDAASHPRLSIGVIATLERGILEAFVESGAAVAAFMIGGIGAGADLSRPVVAALSIYCVFLLWGLMRRHDVD
jgi:hypothetical protein